MRKQKEKKLEQEIINLMRPFIEPFIDPTEKLLNLQGSENERLGRYEAEMMR